MIGQTVSHYQIQSRLGTGGMGEVYKAFDTKLERSVALKFPAPQIMGSTDVRQRFLREARAAAALNHPAICTVYEIDETGSRVFIAMECLEGRSLAERIRAGPLPANEAADIAVQVAEGLQEAHGKGFVHRDIKPANIMITPAGRAVILDFGLVRSLDVVSRLTAAGIVTGTTAYLAPEQVRGGPVDQRADIWALGVVLYEMLAGQRPFEGEIDQATLYQILHEQPRPLAGLVPELPPSLACVIARALAKDLTVRYHGIEQLLDDLVEAPASTDSHDPTNLHAATFHIPSIAVLPFKDLSPQKDQDYFCEGLAEELINALAKIKSLKVVARTSAFQFKGRDQDIREIGAKLNVDNVLEGSVRKSDGRLRIMAQLINVDDGFHVWSEQYDRGLKDIFSIQDEISLAIVETLKVELLGEEKAQLVGKHTVNQQAFDLYLQGRYFWNRRYEGGLQKAIEYFQQAIAKDPDYALAYVGIADSLNILAYYGYLPPKDGFPKAKAAARKALELDATLGEAHASLGWIATFFDWDFPAAEKEFQRAISLSPDYATTRQWYALFLAAVGRLDEALAEARLGKELDPHSLAIYAIEGIVLAFMGRLDEAIENYYQTLEMDPNFLLPHIWLGQALQQLGRYAEAHEHLQKAMEISGGFPFALGVLGANYGLSGRKEEALEVIARFEALAKETYVSPVYWSMPYTGLGMKDEAFGLLAKAVEVRDSFLVWGKAAADFGGLRADPRFADLLRKVGLEE